MKNLYLFDCFGVVVTDVSTLWMQPRLNAEQQIYARTQLFRKVDCGQISFDDCLDALAKICNVPLAQVRSDWDALAEPIPSTLQLIDELRSNGHTVALLSNASQAYVERLFTQFYLYKHFDKIFVSAKYGCAKPDAQFYKICLDSFSEKFDKIYFTDDNPINLVEPQKMGVIPVLFRDAEHLKKALQPY